MGLSSLQLEAFVKVAQTQSFSLAAKQLHLTQSALSQRVLNLEEELQTSLFLREPRGIQLTEKGRQLLKCCLERSALEDEFVSGLKSKDEGELSGLVRIGSFSTLTRSRLIPPLGAFMREHARVQVQVFTRETHQLPRMLRSGEVDFIFCDSVPEKQDWINHRVGYEEYVLIERKGKSSRRPDVYLDHDEHDSTTVDFWRIQRVPPPRVERAYFDEIYTIMDAVAEGVGRAVVPSHLVSGDSRVTIVNGLRPLKVPYYLLYPKQSFYTRLQQQITAVLREI